MARSANAPKRIAVARRQGCIEPSPRLLRRFTGTCCVPPRTDARHALVIAFDHVHRLAQTGGRRRDPDLARLDAALGRHPHAIVAPQARAPGDFLLLPVLGIYHAPAPAIFDHEARWAVGIKRGHLVVDVPAERDADASLDAERKVVALADIVEIVELDHQMMHGIAPSLDEGN